MTFSFSFFHSVSTVTASLALVVSMSTPAAPVVISDSPPLDVNTVPPNLMLTLDNSGSMYWTNVPDLNTNPAAGDLVVGNRCYKNHVANPLYYDPDTVYAIPVTFNTATNATVPLVTTANEPTFNAAPFDGFRPAAFPVVNLQTNFRADSFSDNPATIWTFAGAGNSDTQQAGYHMVYLPGSTAANPAVPAPGYCYPNTMYSPVLLTTGTAAQQRNFAIWFSYYRSRTLAMKTAAGTAFGVLDNVGFRVGFHTIGNSAGTFLNVAPFAGAARRTWYDTFYGVAQTSNGTPLRSAVQRIGEYYAGRGAAAGLPNVVEPLTASCQANYHLLSTDGYWNGDTTLPIPLPGNPDNMIPALPAALPAESYQLPNTANYNGTPNPFVITAAQLASGQPWPPRYRESTGAVPSGAVQTPTLSDIATYYWATDLRTTGALATNNVKANLTDPATWQHVVMFGLAIGAVNSAAVPYSTTNPAVKIQTLAELTTGVRQWPFPVPQTATAIDDLWHATVNSRGDFVNVNTPQQLEAGLVGFLNQISGNSSSGSGAALASANLGAAGASNVTYVPSYKPGNWSGELTSFRLDPATGLVTGGLLWEHSAVLAAQIAGTGWDTNRKILTSVSAGNVVPFRLAQLSTGQRTTLGSTVSTPSTAVSQQQAVLNYIRGDSSNEGLGYNFRTRPRRLGDIVASEPLAIEAPNELYTDATNPGYQAFVTQLKTTTPRTPMVYFGANDGLIHAVNGQGTGADAGKEVWAYLPSELIRTAVDDVLSETGINALSFKDTDPLPKKYKHHFYVDAPPFAKDVDFARTTQAAATPTPNGTGAASPDWRTVMIIGLGKGGKSYVALDVTEPPTTAATEVSLSSKVLWEFTNPDMGYTYGSPVIAKTKRFGWVALLAGGYNNTTGPNAGKGVVFVVDVKTGAVLHKFVTPDGSATDPLGLAHIEAFIPDATDYTATEVYGGDLYGNIWRFDLTNDTNTAYDATSVVKFAEVRDSTGVRQPITTWPTPYADPVTGTRFVAVGTGKLLTPTDISDLQQQTFYNFKDGTVFTAGNTGLPLKRATMQSINRTTATSVSVSATADGWYQDLTAGTGERIIKAPEAPFGIAIAFSMTPSADPCIPGGFGTAYARVGISGDTAINTTGSSPQPFLGGVADSPIFAGSRIVQLKDGPPVVQILTTKPDATGNQIQTIGGIKFPGGFKGTVVNYREVIE